MAWEDILKRRKFNDPRKGKKGGLTDEQRRKYYGYGDSKAAEEAKRKREAILNDPEVIERVRINRLKKRAEGKIKLLEMHIKSNEPEINYWWYEYEHPPKPDEHDAGIDWEKNKDIMTSNILDLVSDNERRKAYVDFLKRAIESNFENVVMSEYQEKMGNMYSIRSTYDEGLSAYEGEDFGDYKKKTKEHFNRIMRRIGWNDKVRK